MFALIISLLIAGYSTLDCESKSCNPKEVFSKMKLNVDSLTLIYQWEANLGHGVSTSATFNISSDSTVGFLKKTIKALRPDTNFNNTWIKRWEKRLKFKQFKREGVLIDSFKIISKEILIVTNSLLSYERPDVKSSVDYFFTNFADYILENGNQYLFKKLGKKQIDLYSYKDINRTSSTYTTFFYLKKINLNNDELIQEYVNSIQYKKVNYNYDFKILGTDSMALKEASLKNFDVIQHFTINFILLYPH